MAIDALDYAAENMAYTVTCGDATGVDAARLTVTHTGSSCDFTIDPVDTLAQSLQGNTSFTIPYTSNGGATATGRITVNIGPDSAITFTPPTGLKIGRNRTLAIDALAAISGENAAYTVSCADATGVDATKMTVTRSSSGNRCSFTVDPVNSLTPANQGDTTFVVAFSSTGGATASGTFTVNIGPDSTIAYTAPTGLLVGRNRTLTVDVSSAATDGSYTVTCGDATNVHSRFSSVTRPDAQSQPVRVRRCASHHSQPGNCQLCRAVYLRRRSRLHRHSVYNHKPAVCYRLHSPRPRLADRHQPHACD